MKSCITEYDKARENEKLWNEALAIGRKQGAERMGSLIRRLIEDNRLSDLERASTDPNYRESLYKEFNL